MKLVLLRDLHFICIFIDAIKSELLTLTFQSDIVFTSYQIITLLLQSERLNQLRVTPLNTTVYLSHLPNLTPSHCLSSIRLSKCIRNEGCFIYKSSPLIIYFDFKATITTRKLIKKRSYRQSCLFSDSIGRQPFIETIILDNKTTVAIPLREKVKI